MWGYGIAVLSVGVALFISRWPAFHLETAPASLFLCAVMFSAWLGGVGPGLLATALACLALSYYFLEPLYSFAVNSDEMPRLVVFIVAALLVGSLSAAQRSATESLRGARDDLIGTVQQLQRTNQALQAESGERKRAEEALRRSEGYLAEAQRLTRSGSWAWNVRTGTVFWSQEIFRIYDYDPEKMKPTWSHFLERVHPEDRPGVEQRARMEATLKQRVDSEGEFRIVLPDGRIKHLHSIARPVMDESGEISEIVGTIMDVTGRRRAEESLRQTQADLAHVSRVTSMGELTASLAHEVNQPIGAAVTNANTCLRWLTRDHPDLEEARAAATRVVNDGRRAAEIISRIRLLFKKGTPEHELVDVNEIIREMIVLLHGEATRYSISVRTELAADLPQIMGDRVQLQQVMMNLIMNSIDAMKDVGGTRELAIKSQLAEDEQLLVSVSDTGVGLPPQQADQIFNAFFTTKLSGTGMGLRISRSIVESHGGQLGAADNSPRGASFHFTLPTKVETQE
jgi:PAS domain S-box-containing protein